MTVCKYFLQGHCKFGDNCWYLHQDRQGNQIANYRFQNRSWQSPSYAASRTSSPGNNYRPQEIGHPQIEAQDLAAAIKEDVISMEEGGQWPLSCYTPFKELGSFPGFFDTSMEEVRFEAYQAQASGTFDQYVKKIGDLIQSTRLKWSMLKNPNPQIMSVIEKMARGQLTDNSASKSLAFNTFSFNSPPSPTTPTPFSLGGNVGFVASVPQQQQQQQPTGNIFSSPQVSSAPASNIFGGPQTSTLPASNFRFILPQQPQTAGNAFGTAQSSFPTPSPPTFGSSTGFGQSGGMMFGNSSVPSISVGMTQSASTGYFGNRPAEQTSTFGGSQTPAPGQTSAFGASAALNTLPQKSVQSAEQDFSIYTQMTDLTESEKKEYQSVTFTLGSIPLRPPAREMCT